MSQVKIKRQFRIVTVNVGTATASCTTLRTEDMAGAVVQIGTISTNATLRTEDMAGAVVQIGTISTNAATLQIWGNTDEAGTFARLYDAGGSAADITLAPSATVATVYALPEQRSWQPPPTASAWPASSLRADANTNPNPQAAASAIVPPTARRIKQAQRGSPWVLF